MKSPKEPSEGNVMAHDLDITVLRIEKKDLVVPFLKIKPPSPSALTLYDHVAICGYPNTSQTLNLTSQYLGVRLSPIMQFGQIVGIMPVDDAPAPNAIQTDIITTGGSSGSPIVDTNSAVIGIAQEVITASVTTWQGRPTEYNAKIGAAYGITNYVLHPMSLQLDKFFLEGKDIQVPVTTHKLYARDLYAVLKDGDRSIPESA